MKLFSIINKKIPYKNDTPFFSQNGKASNKDFFYVKNFEIYENSYHLIKQNILKKDHRQFFKILSGELILSEDQEFQNFRACNYHTLSKRINLENNIEENIKNFLLEDFFYEKSHLADIFNQVCEFIEISPEEKFLAIENFSTGFRQRIKYSIPLFLNYNLFILNKVDDSIDRNFKIKIYEKILNLDKNNKTVIFDFKDNYFQEKINKIIDFNDYTNISTYNSGEEIIFNKAALNQKNLIYLSNQNDTENNSFQSSEKIKIIFHDRELKFYNKRFDLKISLYSDNCVICEKKIFIEIKKKKFCFLEINPFFLTSTNYRLEIEIISKENDKISLYFEKEFSIKNDFREDLNSKDNNGALLAPKIDWI